MYTNMHVSVYLCVNISVHVCVYTCACLSVYVQVCGMPNTKFVSLACMQNKPKSVKCKNGISVCVSLSVHVSGPFINLVSLA